MQKVFRITITAAPVFNNLWIVQADKNLSIVLQAQACPYKSV